MCSSPLSSPPFQEVASHFSDWPFSHHDALGRVGRRSAARCIWKVKSLSIDADSEVVCIRQLFPLLKNTKTEGGLSIIFMQSSQLRSRRIIKPISFWQRKVKPAEDEDTDNGAAGEDKEELVPSLLVKDVRERWTRSGYHPSLFLDQWLLQVDEKRLIKAPQTQSFRFLFLSWLQKKQRIRCYSAYRYMFEALMWLGAKSGLDSPKTVMTSRAPVVQRCCPTWQKWQQNIVHIMIFSIIFVSRQWIWPLWQGQILTHLNELRFNVVFDL